MMEGYIKAVQLDSVEVTFWVAMLRHDIPVEFVDNLTLNLPNHNNLGVKNWKLELNVYWVVGK